MATVNELITQISAGRDKFGCIVQPDGDGGDTLNRTSHYRGALSILSSGPRTSYEFDLETITKGLENGRYRRHPDPTRWYYNSDNVTRDQMGPTEATLALYGLSDTLRTHLKLRLKRCLFHFDSENNGLDKGPLIHKFPDPPSPEEIAVMIRGLKLWFLYPLLLLLDMLLVVDVQNDLQEGQVILNVAVANKIYKTPFAMIAKELLKTKATGDAELRAYYGPDRNGIVPLGELMILAKAAL